MNLTQPMHLSCHEISTGAASRLRTLCIQRKAYLHRTKHPNALPASWHCSGQLKGVDLRVCFNSARPVRFRSGMRLRQLCRRQFNQNRSYLQCLRPRPLSQSKNSQFFLPTALRRMAFSTRLSTQNPKLFAAPTEHSPMLANGSKGATAPTSKTPNDFRGPHGYAAFCTGSSRVNID